jgi:hypothetical protein
MAERRAGAGDSIGGLRIEVTNDVVLNQVLVRFLPTGASSGPGEARMERQITPGVDG